MTFDTLITNINLATFNSEFGFCCGTPYGQILDTNIGIQDGKISLIGELPQDFSTKNVIDAQGKWATPALIDCHTHVVYAGNRSDEFEMRLNGVDYKDIAKAGGGILASVRATRGASFDELYEYSVPRVRAMIAQGIGTIEIKSGYGLDLPTERKMLQVAQKIGEDFGITVQKTYLALHALPPEYAGKSDEYVEQACAWLRILHGEGLVDAVDAFCESIAFDAAQVGRLFAVAKELNLPVKLHAEQMSDMGGGALVADFGGLSADHIEYLSTMSIDKMAQAGVVGVLLPTAFYVLKETKKPPIDQMRHKGINMAVSTDCNPGTSPTVSLLLAMNMACTLFGLTCQEALAGTTIHAARALGLQDTKGQIKVGMDADLAIWDIDRPADLVYLIGERRLDSLIIQGKHV
ncbi:imidazolonepropionase [Moraxella nasovis]|uniref:imidazolonepropionase n=1 Tax=Moraxella nasovis TaxID=2904121 RepID=UPI001F624F1F|nr:imidazolonepropionase [Moraxella nasovis]UNU73118.1 imidazolonepropionase [Moraxella nasovis]